MEELKVSYLTKLTIIELLQTRINDLEQFIRNWSVQDLQPHGSIETLKQCKQALKEIEDNEK